MAGRQKSTCARRKSAPDRISGELDQAPVHFSGHFGDRRAFCSNNYGQILVKKQADRRPRKGIQNLRSHPEPYVTVGELANYWLVSRKLIYGHVESGALKAVKLGPRLLRIQTAAAIEFEKRAKLLPGTISARRSLPHKSTSRLQRRRP